MDAKSAIIGFTHSASFWIIYLIFISNIKNGVYKITHQVAHKRSYESLNKMCVEKKVI